MNWILRTKSAALANIMQVRHMIHQADLHVCTSYCQLEVPYWLDTIEYFHWMQQVVQNLGQCYGGGIDLIQVSASALQQNTCLREEERVTSSLPSSSAHVEDFTR
jgi:hypothetical protein